MITWMQRHKRWLVITIWISTIAFVGAGFVGWGSYDYGKSSGNIGVVGTKEIKMADLQSEYNTLYSQYQEALGGGFNQEMAKQFKLEDAAFNSVVQKFLILNYAHELGLYITDNEVAKYLVQIPAFQKDNKFDKNAYLAVLKQNRNTPTDFEEKVKRDLLIQKVQLLVGSKVMDNEVLNITKLVTMEDEVSIKIIKKTNLKINTSKESIKEYWEVNKQNYKTVEAIKIAMTKVKIGEDRKVSKKDALKKYLKLKKDEIKFDKTIEVSSQTNDLTIKNLEEVSKASIDSILKPIENNGYYLVIKVLEKQQPKPLSFDKAYKLVKVDYMDFAKENMLIDKVTKATKDFKGKSLGYITQNVTQEIKGLDKDEVEKVIKHIFSSQTTINSIVLANKAVVYEITNSRFNKDEDIQSKELRETLKGIKNNEIMTNLLTQLKNKYQVISNMKAN